LEVVDLKAGQRIRSVPNFNEPKWAAYRPETNRIYVATAVDGKVTVLDANSFAVIKTFQFKDKANNLRFDPATKELFVGEGKTDGAIGIIDTAADKVTGHIKLASFPKQFELEGNLIYVNVPEANHIAVVDRAKKAVIATWPVKEAKENVPMGFDRAQQRLFVACDPGKFVVFDTATGKSVASLDIAEGADGIAYDAARKLVYISCGAGSVEVIQQTDANHYQLVGRVPTVSGAGTSLFVPEFGRLYVLVPQSDKQQAEIRVLAAAK
jgi:DNA-binding beta-propeller fold protein YncE